MNLRIGDPIKANIGERKKSNYEVWCVIAHPDFEEGCGAGWAERKGRDPLSAGAAGCFERDDGRWSSGETVITSLLLLASKLSLKLFSEILVSFCFSGCPETRGETLIAQKFESLLK